METVEVVDRETSTASAPEIEELAGLIALGRERGYLTYEQISSTLEEVEITKEQVSQLHANLVEHGVDVAVFVAGAVILHQPIRRQHVAANLAAERDRHQFAQRDFCGGRV